MLKANVIRLLSVVLVIGGVLAAIGLGLENKNTNKAEVSVVKQLPAFDAPDLLDPNSRVTQQDFLISDYKLLNVWASWCGICLSEHAFLKNLAQQGVPIYGLNYRDESRAATRYLQQHGNPFVKVAQDPQGSVALDLGVIGTPETYLINSAGEIVFKYSGQLTQEKWQRYFQTYFKQES